MFSIIDNYFEVGQQFIIVLVVEPDKIYGDKIIFQRWQFYLLNLTMQVMQFAEDFTEYLRSWYIIFIT